MGAVTKLSLFREWFWIQKCFEGFYSFVTDGLVLCFRFLSGFCTEYCFCGYSGYKIGDVLGYPDIFGLKDFYRIFL